MDNQKAAEILLKRFAFNSEMINNNQEYLGERPEDHWMSQAEWNSEQAMLNSEIEENKALRLAIITLDPSYTDTEKFDSKVSEIILERSGVSDLEDPGEFENQLLPLFTELEHFEISDAPEVLVKTWSENDGIDWIDAEYWDVYRYQGRIFIIVNNDSDVAMDYLSEEFQKVLTEFITNNKK